MATAAPLNRLKTETRYDVTVRAQKAEAQVKSLKYDMQTLRAKLETADRRARELEALLRQNGSDREMELRQAMELCVQKLEHCGEREQKCEAGTRQLVSHQQHLEEDLSLVMKALKLCEAGNDPLRPFSVPAAAAPRHVRRGLAPIVPLQL